MVAKVAFFVSAHGVGWDGDLLFTDADLTVRDQLAGLLHGAGQSLVVDLSLQASVQHVFGAE